MSKRSRTGAVCLFFCLASLPALLRGQASVLTWHNDNSRTGQNLQETTLTPANVNSASFGRLFTMPVDGKVDAQPLYAPALTIPAKGVHNVLFVATEHDSVYAFDADSAVQLWKVSLLGINETTSDNRGCSQVTPEIGITATPAIDLGTGPHGTIYVIAMSKDSSNQYHHRLHALDLTTGAEQFSGPMEVQATYPGTGAEGSGTTQTFSPPQHKERAALLISNGVLYTSWSSHCDIAPYTGWVIGYDIATLRQVSVMNLTPNGNDGAMWGAGAGPAADAQGNVYVMTGNGTFDTSLNGGFPASKDYGNAFVQLSTSPGLSVHDYFTMSNSVSESNADTDLGSGGLLLLPPLNDAQNVSRSLMVGAGKDAKIYVLDRANLGKFSANTNNIYQQLSSTISGSVFSTPAWFNGKLYYGSSGDAVKALTFVNGAFNPTPATSTTAHFTYPGATPSISANGTLNGIVWVAENVAPAVLHAYDANSLSVELYNSGQASGGRDNFGSGNKYIVPTVVNGKVYVGTTNSVGVFGLLCSYALAPQTITVSAAATTGMINLIAGNGCPWTAVSNAGWLSITSSSSGTGSATISYSVAALTSNSRNGALTIGGQTFTVSQIAAGAAKVGIYRSGLWQLDTNGTGTFENGVDKSFNLGFSGATQVLGDWNGDGRTKVGVYNNGYWFLDYDGNGVWDGGVVDKQIAWGWAGATPIVGDWNGDGKTKIGVYSNGFWFLDYDGNYIWDGGVVDKQVGWGWAGVTPIVGDWNGNGKTKIGVYSNGFWFLDYDGNFLWDGGVVDKQVGWGWAGVTPVVGDWNGDGKTKIGVYSGGSWCLDYDGNYLWEYPAKDQIWNLGWAGTTPVVGDWNGDGKTKAGAFINGFWYLDYNGNGMFDGSGTDRIYSFGIAGDVPVTGRW